MKNQYVLHSGVKGMKWGVRKEYDKNQMVKDTRRLNKAFYNYHSAKRLAKKTQKRMTNKNETHSKALSTVIRRDVLKRVLTTTIAGAYILSPRFRGFTNSAIKKLEERLCKQQLERMKLYAQLLLWLAELPTL